MSYPYGYRPREMEKLAIISVAIILQGVQNIQILCKVPIIMRNVDATLFYPKYDGTDTNVKHVSGFFTGVHLAYDDPKKSN